MWDKPWWLKWFSIGDNKTDVDKINFKSEEENEVFHISINKNYKQNNSRGSFNRNSQNLKFIIIIKNESI